MTDALLGDLAPLAPPTIIDIAAHHALTVHPITTSDTLERTIRRGIQYLARTARVDHGTRCGSFSARFPHRATHEPFTVHIAGRLDSPLPTSTLRPAERHLNLTWAGPLTLLHLAHQLVIDTAYTQGLTIDGTIVEHYPDLTGTRTDVAVTITHP